MNNIFVQCGVAGATLFVLFVLGKEFFKYLNKRLDLEKENSKQGNKNNNSAFTSVVTSMDRLCDKMDKLIDAYHCNTSTTVQNQASIKDSYGIQLTLLQDIKTKVDSIDERTKILIPEKEGVRA